MNIFVKALEKIPRKMDVKTLLLIALTIIVLIEILFMWFFIKKQTPVIGFSPVALNEEINPKYLYSLGFQVNNSDASLEAPLDVAVDRFGRTYVVDTGNNSIKVYNSYGQYQFKFGQLGQAPGQLSDPTGIAINGDYLYVAEAGNQRVSVFDLNGKFVNFLIREKVLAKLGGMVPSGISISPQGVILVTDIFKHRIIGFTQDGYKLFAFGKPGQEAGSLAYPNDVAEDNKGNIYVSDSNNARVQVFDRTGKFLYILQDKDPKKKFSLPRGIAIKDNFIFVVDTFNHTVRIMTKERQISQFGHYGSENGQLNYPNGVAVFGDKIYVTDRANDRVAVFNF